jgi:hypothetical protein
MSQNSVASAKNNYINLFYKHILYWFCVAYVLQTLVETKPGIGKWHKKTISIWT